MKTNVIVLLSFLFSLSSLSQITFEKAYYIDNSNSKVDCLIKNVDWKNNPMSFEFVLTENAPSSILGLANVKEFGIYNKSKYIRETVQIDRSSNDVTYMSKVKDPEFTSEKLFLKVLVEGKSNLYEFVDGNLRRFFYDKENSGIEQLVYKRYKTSESDISINNKFRQQLWIDLKCPNFEIKKIERINYTKNDLLNFFMEYSTCSNQEANNFGAKDKKDLFNLTLRPRITNSSLSIVNNAASNYNTDFDNETSFGFGVEAEFILPFNQNKWSIVVEPTYQSFSSTKTKSSTIVSGGEQIAKAKYNSIEVPFSLRYYMFTSDKSAFFITSSYVVDFSSNSVIEIKRIDNSVLNTIDVETRNNFALGFGYKTKEKYSLELKYQFSREILGSYTYWESSYKSVSVIFGYTLF